MSMIKDYIHKRRAARNSVRLSSTRDFKNDSLMQIESNARLGKVEVDLSQSRFPLLQIGAYSYVRSGTRLLCVGNIGRFCSIGRHVTLGLNPRNHPCDWVSTYPLFSRHYNQKVTPAEVGHDVWIGDRAVIMAGITIGHGAIIGCDAVVTKDVLPYQIVAGNPARPIRFRFDEKTVSALLASEWWRYAKAELDRIDFENIESFLSSSRSFVHVARYDRVQFHGRKVVKSSEFSEQASRQGCHPAPARG